MTQEHSPAAPPRPAPAPLRPGEANKRLQESQNDCNQEYLKQFLIVYQLAAETQKVQRESAAFLAGESLARKRHIAPRRASPPAIFEIMYRY